MKDEYLTEIARLEAQFGPDDPRVGEALARLAFWLAENRIYSEGAPYFARSIAVLERQSGTNPTLASMLDRWAELTLRKRDLTTAEPFMLKSLAIKEAAFGTESAEVAAALDILIAHYRGQLHIAKALPYVERRVAIAEANEGPASVTLAPRLRDLAGLLMIVERPAEAEPLMRRALAILEGALPDDEKEVMSALDGLVWVLAVMDRFEEARAILLRSLAIRRRLFTDEPMRHVQPLEFLLSHYRQRGRLAEGVDLIVTGMKFDISDLPEVAVMLLNLAELLSDEQYVAEASRIGKLSLGVIGRMLRADNVDALEGLRRLPRERKRGFLERARIVADPDHSHAFPRWAPDQPLTASFWNKPKGE